MLTKLTEITSEAQNSASTMTDGNQPILASAPGVPGVPLVYKNILKKLRQSDQSVNQKTALWDQLSQLTLQLVIGSDMTISFMPHYITSSILALIPGPR